MLLTVGKISSRNKKLTSTFSNPFYLTLVGWYASKNLFKVNSGIKKKINFNICSKLTIKKETGTTSVQF